MAPTGIDAESAQRSGYASHAGGLLVAIGIGLSLWWNRVRAPG